MGTDIRPELSEKNKYYISKHRYYELKHFVMQYPEWVKFIQENEGSSFVRSSIKGDKTQLNSVSDPTFEAAQRCLIFSRYIDVVNRAATHTGRLGKLIMNNVIEGVGFKDWSETASKASRDEYYILYRKFFWILDKIRDDGKWIVGLRASVKWEHRFANNGWMDHICPVCGYVENTDVHVNLDWRYCPSCGTPIEQ